jgi:hypothetical protein
MALTPNGLLALHDGIGSAATYTSSATEQSGFPLSRLQGTSLAQAARLAVGSLTSVQINIDLGANVTANTCGIFGGNFSLGLQRRFQASTVSDFSSVAAQSGATLTDGYDTSLPVLSGPEGTWAPRWGWPLIYTHPTDFTARYHRWTLTDTGNADGYLRAAIYRCGLAWQPLRNFQAGWSSVDEKNNQRGHRLSFHRLTRSELSQVTSLCRALEGYGRLLVIPDPDAPETWLMEALLARIEGELTYEHVARKLFSAQLTFREVDE